MKYIWFMKYLTCLLFSTFNPKFFKIPIINSRGVGDGTIDLGVVLVFEPSHGYFRFFSSPSTCFRLQCFHSDWRVANILSHLSQWGMLSVQWLECKWMSYRILSNNIVSHPMSSKMSSNVIQYHPLSSKMSSNVIQCHPNLLYYY